MPTKKPPKIHHERIVKDKESQILIDVLFDDIFEQVLEEKPSLFEKLKKA